MSLLGALALVLVGQIAPSPEQLASYTGLHRAAARGETEELKAILGRRGDPNARDAYGLAHYAVAPLAAHTPGMHATILAEVLTALLLLVAIAIQLKKRQGSA
jgi:ankyrin repeat protein